MGGWQKAEVELGTTVWGHFFQGLCNCVWIRYSLGTANHLGSLNPSMNIINFKGVGGGVRLPLPLHMSLQCNM